MEVEATEENTVKEESSGKSISPLRHCALFLRQHKDWQMSMTMTIGEYT